VCFKAILCGFVSVSGNISTPSGGGVCPGSVMTNLHDVRRPIKKKISMEKKALPFACALAARTCPRWLEAGSKCAVFPSHRQSCNAHPSQAYLSAAVEKMA
jgi:hypothetical protein